VSLHPGEKYYHTTGNCTGNFRCGSTIHVGVASHAEPLKMLRVA